MFFLSNFRHKFFSTKISILALIISLTVPYIEARVLYKRSFAGLGCLGVNDRPKFARLDRVCEECYQLYREQDLFTNCRFANIFDFFFIDFLEWD
jgi:hypothetical protein